MGQRFLLEPSIKRLNHLQQPEVCLTFPLLFHLAEMKRYLFYDLHIATQSEGMEVTGMERGTKVLFLIAMPCLYPWGAAWLLPGLPGKAPTQQDQMLLNEGTSALAVLEGGLNRNPPRQDCFIS